MGIEIGNVEMCGTVFFDLFVVHTSIFPHHFDQATRPEMFLIECAAKYREGVPIWEYGKTEELEEASRESGLALSAVGNFIKFRELCLLRFHQSRARCELRYSTLSWEFFSQFELHN